MTTKTKKTKPAAPKFDPDVFLRAAERLDREDPNAPLSSTFACNAIYHETHEQGYVEAFAGLYEADSRATGEYSYYAFFSRVGEDSDYDNEKPHRVFALLLAYELARRGELPL